MYSCVLVYHVCRESRGIVRGSSTFKQTTNRCLLLLSIW